MTDNLKGEYAGFVSRLMAYTLDLLVIFILLAVTSWLLQAISTIFQFQFIQQINTFFRALFAGVGVLITTTIYYIFFWSLIGQTPGKWFLGIRVVGTQRYEITFWQALRRFIGYFLSALALFAGFWWVLIDNRRQGWHDKLAGTYVIYDWEARPGSLMQAKLAEGQEEETETP